MFRFVSLFLALWLVGGPCLVSAAQVEEARRTRVAVVDFANMSGRQEYDRLAQIIPEVLSTNWAASGKIDLVERGRLQDAIREMQLGLSGLVEVESAAELGRAVGADAIVVGSFILFGETIRITSRLIDVQTGKVITGRSVDGPARRGELGGEVLRKMDELSRLMEESLMGEPGTPPEPETPVMEEPTPVQPESSQLEMAQREVEEQPTEAPKKGGGSILGKWWFWGAVAAVGGGAALALSGGGDDGGATSTTVGITITIP